MRKRFLTLLVPAAGAVLSMGSPANGASPLPGACGTGGAIGEANSEP